MRVRMRGAMLAAAPVLSVAMLVFIDAAKRWH